MPMRFIQLSRPHAPGEEAPGKAGRLLLALLSTGVCPKVPVCRAAVSAGGGGRCVEALRREVGRAPRAPGRGEEPWVPAPQGTPH